MNAIYRAILALSFLFASSATHAATHNVVSGQSLQAVVDASASGDYIRLLSATYGDVKIVNKDLVIKSMGQTPAFMGNLEIEGSFVRLIRTRASTLKASDLPGDPGKLHIVQGDFITADVNCSQSKILYTTFKHLTIAKKGLVVGCEFDGKAGIGIGIDVYGAGSVVTIRNSRIHDYSASTDSELTETLIGIRVRDNADAFILNNLIYSCKDTDVDGKETDSGMGVWVKDGSKVTILGNVIWDCFIHPYSSTNPAHRNTRGNSLIYAPLGTVVRHNVLYKNNVHVNLYEGSVTPNEVINTEPLFVNLAAGNFTLQVTSPCINAGPPDPQYNDRDGTRNDIGMYGGHNFIPDGKTTNKPIVIDLEATPIAVPAGGVITIRSTGATTK